jgi:hypothetical protein
MWHAWGKSEIYAGYRLENRKERGSFEGLVVDRGIIRFKSLKKQDWIVGGGMEFL